MTLNIPEDRQKGDITKETWIEFITALGGWSIVIFTLLVALAAAVILMYSSKYLEEWS
jgi:uncharacterized protein (DUF927 family)